MSNQNESQTDNRHNSTAPGKNQGDGADTYPPRQPEVAGQGSDGTQQKGSDKDGGSQGDSNRGNPGGQSGKQSGQDSGGQGGKGSDQSGKSSQR